MNLSAPVEWPATIASVTADRVAIVERGMPRLRVLTVSSTVLPVTNLTAPEINSVSRPANTPTMASVIFGTFAADEEGRMFADVWPYSPEKGAIVLEFDDHASLRSRLLCSLPTYDDLKARGNPGGHLVPSRIAAAGGRLYLLSSEGHGNRCVSYRLSPR